MLRSARVSHGGELHEQPVGKSEEADSNINAVIPLPLGELAKNMVLESIHQGLSSDYGLRVGLVVLHPYF